MARIALSGFASSSKSCISPLIKITQPAQPSHDIELRLRPHELQVTVLATAHTRSIWSVWIWARFLKTLLSISQFICYTHFELGFDCFIEFSIIGRLDSRSLWKSSSNILTIQRRVRPEYRGWLSRDFQLSYSIYITQYLFTKIHLLLTAQLM